MQLRTKKYILDIKSAIEEIESLIVQCKSDFGTFEETPLAHRSLERLLEIIGEAMKKLLESDPTIRIENSQRIISLRNRLAHAYSSIELPIIWAIAIKNVPELKEEINRLK